MNSQKIGIIQALGLGYESVVRSLWIILIPVVLDLFFWLGPHLSMQSTFAWLAAASAASNSDAAGFPLYSEEMRVALQSIGSSINLFSLLATRFLGAQILPLPSLKAFELPPDLGGAPVTVNVPVIAVDDAFAVLGISILLMIIGLLIGAIYLTLLADKVRANAQPTRALGTRVIHHWLRLVLFVALLALVFIVASIPFLLVAFVATLVSPTIGALIMIGGMTLSYWILLYLWFVSYALVLDDVGLMRAIWYSANVVQRNLFPTFGLVVLTYIIAQGMLVVWQIFEVNWLGNLLAIAGNAFIGTGLVAAAFYFYQDRLRAWLAQSSGLRVMGSMPR